MKWLESSLLRRENGVPPVFVCLSHCLLFRRTYSDRRNFYSIVSAFKEYVNLCVLRYANGDVRFEQRSPWHVMQD